MKNEDGLSSISSHGTPFFAIGDWELMLNNNVLSHFLEMLEVDTLWTLTKLYSWLCRRTWVT